MWCTRSRFYCPASSTRPSNCTSTVIYNASLQWLQQQHHSHVSHHQARWRNLLAEYQLSVLHILGRTDPADFKFLTWKRFPDCSGPAPHTGDDEPDLVLWLFTASGAAPASAFVTAGPDFEFTPQLHGRLASCPGTPTSLHWFARRCRLTLSVLGPLAAAAQAQDHSAACPSLAAPSSAVTAGH